MKLTKKLFSFVCWSSLVACAMEDQIPTQQSKNVGVNHSLAPKTLDILNKARVNVSIKKGVENKEGVLVGPDTLSTASFKDPLHIFSLLKTKCLSIIKDLGQNNEEEEFILALNMLLLHLDRYKISLQNIRFKAETRKFIDSSLLEFQDTVKEMDNKNQTSTDLAMKLPEILELIKLSRSQEIKLGTGEMIPLGERFQGSKNEEYEDTHTKTNILSSLPYTQTEVQMKLFPEGKGDGSPEDIENTLNYLMNLNDSGVMSNYVKGNYINLKLRLNEIINEEINHKDKVVLYAASSNGNFSLILLFTAMMEILKLQAEQNLKTIRLLQPLSDTIEEFYSSIFDNGDNDQGIAFARNGLSTSLSLVDYGPSEAALYFWLKNSNTRRNFGEKLQQVLKSLGIDFDPKGSSSPLEKTFQKMSNYIDSFSGSLMQIFINPEVVDGIAWPARPWGFRMEYQLPTNEEEPLTITGLKELIFAIRTDPYNYYKLSTRVKGQDSWSKKESQDTPLFTNAQARLFIDPKILLNNKHVIIKDYFLIEPDPEKLKHYRQFQG